MGAGSARGGFVVRGPVVTAQTRGPRADRDPNAIRTLGLRFEVVSTEAEERLLRALMVAVSVGIASWWLRPGRRT